MRPRRTGFPAKQRHFLRLVRDDQKTLDELKELVGIDEKRLMRWLRRPKFLVALRQALRNARRRIGLEIQLGSNDAKRKLLSLSRDEGRKKQSAQLLRANCQCVIDLAEKNRGRRSCRAGNRRGQPTIPQPVLPGPHPDVPLDQVAELERILDE